MAAVVSSTNSVESHSPTNSPIIAPLVGYAAVHAAGGDIVELRKNPEPSDIVNLPSAFRRHADEQTVLALTAVTRAIHRFGLEDQDFTAWGVTGAPQFLGRVVSAGALTKYMHLGPRAISPHIMAQHSLHSLAGAVSVALGTNGPNYGVGGGRNSWQDGLLAGMTMLSDESPAPLWILLTAWDPEPIPDERGRVVTDGICHAVAMAVDPCRESWTGPRLHFEWNDGPPDSPSFDVPYLGTQLSNANQDVPPTWTCKLDCGLEVSCK